MRENYTRDLNRVHDALIDMGSMIEAAISGAVSVLYNHDEKKAREIIAFDEEVDAKEREIEDLCMKLLLRQQPVAGDLRKISVALKLITDMERIGDHAADISEIAMMLKEAPNPGKTHLQEMAMQTSTMLISSIESYVELDIDKAQKVIAHDDIVDDLFVSVKRELIEQMRTNPEQGEMAADLLMAAKYFERIGDHATNIAEWVIYAATGKHAEI